jgi:hypothetical protein
MTIRRGPNPRTAFAIVLRNGSDETEGRDCTPIAFGLVQVLVPVASLRVRHLEHDARPARDRKYAVALLVRARQQPGGRAGVGVLVTQADRDQVDQRVDLAGVREPLQGCRLRRLRRRGSRRRRDLDSGGQLIDLRGKVLMVLLERLGERLVVLLQVARVLGHRRCRVVGVELFSGLGEQVAGLRRDPCVEIAAKLLE